MTAHACGRVEPAERAERLRSPAAVLDRTLFGEGVEAREQGRVEGDGERRLPLGQPDPVGLGRAHYAKTIADDWARWGAVVREIGLKGD